MSMNKLVAVILLRSSIELALLLILALKGIQDIPFAVKTRPILMTISTPETCKSDFLDIC